MAVKCREKKSMNGEQNGGDIEKSQKKKKNIYIYSIKLKNK